MKTKTQKDWAKGKYLPPRKKGYISLYEYQEEIHGYAIKAVEAYKESRREY